ADEHLRDGLRALLLALVDELDLAGDGGLDGGEVAEADGGFGLAVEEGAALGGGEEGFEGGAGEAGGDAGLLVDVFRGAGLEGDLLDDLAEVVGEVDGDLAAAVLPGLLLRDLDADLDGLRVV